MLGVEGGNGHCAISIWSRERADGIRGRGIVLGSGGLCGFGIGVGILSVGVVIDVGVRNNNGKIIVITGGIVGMGAPIVSTGAA